MINVLCGRERGGWINPQLHTRLFEAIHDANVQRRPAAIEMMQGTTPVDKARNQIVQHFLQTQYAWLVMVDNDIVPPDHFMNVITAAEEDAKFIVGLPYPIIKETGVTLSVGYKSPDQLIAGLYTNNLPQGWTCLRC
jgi:hypothetical protein